MDVCLCGGGERVYGCGADNHFPIAKYLIRYREDQERRGTNS